MAALQRIVTEHTLKVGVKVRRNRPLFTDTKFYQGNSSYTGVETQNPAATAGTGTPLRISCWATHSRWSARPRAFRLVDLPGFSSTSFRTISG